MAAAAGNRARVVATSFFLFCISLFLTAYSAKNPSMVRSGFAVFSEFLRPVQILNSSAHSSVTGVWDGYVSLIDVKEENKRLRERLNALESANSALLEFKDENVRLRGLLGIIQEGGMDGIAARVIGYDPSNWVQAITVDRGSQHGIEPGMAVVENEGVVGQVMSTSLGTSRVLLITDHGSGVDAIVQSNRARGVLEGSGGGTCKLLYVSVGEQVAVGDRIITSGMDGVYPKGLLLGVVSEIKSRSEGLFQSIEVKPSVVFSKLENVLIVTDSSRRAEVPEIAGPVPERIPVSEEPASEAASEPAPVPVEDISAASPASTPAAATQPPTSPAAAD